MKKVYDYCDRCNSPIYRSDEPQGKVELCPKCARELYQKIFGNEPPNKKEGA